MLYIALSLLASAVFAKYKGPCDLKRECAKRVFDDSGSNALCFGYQACLKAEFNTLGNAICSGAEACMKSSYPEYTDDKAPRKVLCNGFKSCYEARGGDDRKTGLQAKDKVACNGFKSCQGITGGITTDGDIMCDGDLSCASELDSYADNLMLTATTAVMCNGHKACKYANIDATAYVGCDGDATCRNGRIKSGGAVGCGGKKACQYATIEAPYVYGYGMFGAFGSTIKDSSDYLTVKALGFNALALSRVIATSAQFVMYAYGWKGANGASIKCKQGSTCTIICKTTACKNSAIFVDSSSELFITPNGCDPDDPAYAESKANPGLPAKQLGIHCPAITKAGKTTGITDEELEILATEFEENVKLIPEIQELIAEVAQMDKELDAILAEKELVFDEQEAYEASQDLGAAEFMVEGNQLIGATHSHSHNLVMSNLLTALAVFVITLVIAVVYYAYKAPKNGQYKPLLN